MLFKFKRKLSPENLPLLLLIALFAIKQGEVVIISFTRENTTFIKILNLKACIYSLMIPNTLLDVEEFLFIETVEGTVVVSRSSH